MVIGRLSALGTENWDRRGSEIRDIPDALARFGPYGRSRKTERGFPGMRMGARRWVMLAAVGAIGVMASTLAMAAPARASVYWTNPGGGSGMTIGRANADGSAVKQDLISGASGPEGVAVDGAHIYWANPGTHSIGRANLDGSSPNPGFISGASDPYGVAVDGAHIYWTNVTTGTIGRANLDGGAADDHFISGGSDPEGIAVDGRHIYWANAFSELIGRANLDGSAVDQSFIVEANSPRGIAVDGQHIYW